MRLIYLILIIALATACGKSKKQLLKIEEDTTIVAPRDSLQQSRIVYNAASPKPVMQSYATKGTKRMDTNNPPIKLDLSNTSLAEKEINLGDFYGTATFIKLKHPFSKSGGGYLGNTVAKVYWSHANGEGVSTSPRSSEVHLSDNLIVAGDVFFGYHVYDPSGEFLYTLAEREPLPILDKKNNLVTVQSGTKSEVEGFATLDDKAVITTREDTLFYLHHYDLKQQKGLTNVEIRAGRVEMIDEDRFLVYNPWTNIPLNSPYLRSGNAETGAYLYHFINSNASLEIKGSMTNPESHLFKHYNNELFTRQAYNDTIFRIKSESMMNPAYVLDKGTMHLPLEDAFKGSKEGKLIIRYWLETDDFMFVACSINHDTPNNRNAGVVQYRYYNYSKKEKKLYANTLQEFPEEYVLKSTLEGAIPLLAQSAKIFNKKLYACYTKGQLRAMFADENNKNYTLSQLQKIEELHDSLEEGELLIQILE